MFLLVAVSMVSAAQQPSAGKRPAATDVCPEPAAGADAALDRGIVEASAYALAEWIAESRDAAVRAGVERVPDRVRGKLEGFVPDAVLEQVRWRTGTDSSTSLQSYLFGFGTVAVTLDDVVVFASAADAEDAGLWAHELRHVMQYQACGIAGFARLYVTRHDALEAQSQEYASRWHQWSLDRWLQKIGADTPAS
jgi:hypothetical protein